MFSSPDGNNTKCRDKRNANYSRRERLAYCSPHSLVLEVLDYRDEIARFASLMPHVTLLFMVLVEVNCSIY